MNKITALYSVFIRFHILRNEIVTQRYENENFALNEAWNPVVDPAI